MKLQIGDALFELEYTINAVCDLEELTGKNLGEALTIGGFASLRAMLWCGLIEHMKGLTIAKAGNLLQEYMKTGSMEELVQTMTAAIEQAGFLNAQTEKAAK